MWDHFKKSVAIGVAMALYASGAFLGVLGGCMVIGIGGIAIFGGIDLVHEILVSAGASATGLTIGDVGRKKLQALQTRAADHVSSGLIKHAS